MPASSPSADSSPPAETSRALIQWLRSLYGAGLMELPRRAPLDGLTARNATPAESVTATAATAPAHAAERAVSPSHIPPPSPAVKPDTPLAGKPIASPAAPHFSAAMTSKARSRPTAPQTSETAPLALPDRGGEVPHEDRAAALAALRQQVRGCTRCTALACTRTQTVFGVGAASPRVCFLGEAPGADEDKQGEPFVGAAGQLLNRILAASGLAREEVYILNVLKCRPPGNRTPEPAEVENCRPFFERQLEILRPEFIVCLGAVAAQSLLNVKTPIGRLRGAFHDYRGAKVMATYHPAYLLRNPASKRDVWEDMQKLIAAMGRELPPAAKNNPVSAPGARTV